jgi:two-component system, LuxR family, sensor kinase FixL
MSREALVLAVAILVTAQAALIVALLVNRARRRESQARNSAILRALPDLMFVQTRDRGIYVDYSAKESDLLVPPEQFLGRSMHDVLPPELAQRFEAGLERLFRGEEPVVVDYELTLPSGRAGYYEARLVRCDNDKFLSIVRDVTAQKEAEAALHRANVELLHASKLATLGEFAGSAAHELAQPLTAMIADTYATRRLLDAEPPRVEEARHSLDDALTSGAVVREVIHHMRHLFVNGDPEQQPLDLADIVNEVCAMVSSTLQAHRVSLEVTLDLGHRKIHGDRVQLRQVILNLISNGIQAMDDLDEASQRRLTISAAEAENNTATFTVCDTGVGLSDHERERLFTQPHTTKPDGMGWGLSISRSIIEAHGGRMWAEPNDGGGAKFSFSLPLPASGSSVTAYRKSPVATPQLGIGE